MSQVRAARAPEARERLRSGPVFDLGAQHAHPFAPRVIQELADEHRAVGAVQRSAHELEPHTVHAGELETTHADPRGATDGASQGGQGLTKRREATRLGRAQYSARRIAR